jgi:hypothetical protein
MKSFIKFFLAIVCFTTNANELNTSSTNKVGQQYWPTKVDGALWADKIETGKIPRECLPAKDFPEGNWGEATNGCQVSLRFNKQIYTNGEPIEGTILMRNLSDQGIPILVHPSGKWNDLVGFVVTNRFGKLYINQSTPRYFQSSGGYSLAPQIQQKHLKFLNGDYSLTNGTYSVHAEIRTIPINLPQRMANEPVAGKLVMVKSAEVQIIITNSP